MPTLRTRIFIIISAAVLLILGISLIIVVVSKKTKTLEGEALPAPKVIDSANFTGQTIVGTPATPTEVTGATVAPATPEEVQRNAARAVAKIFYERLGTYSTDNSYQNIRDVETLVTPSLWSKLSAQIRPVSAGTQFSGATTQVVSASLAEWTASVGTVDISARKTEEKNGAETMIQQQARIKVVKSGDAWLVDSYTVEK